MFGLVISSASSALSRIRLSADDVVIFVKSEKSANRVMRSVSDWLERKLFLKVSPTKTKVCRPTKSTFLGFTFWKNGQEWKARPADDRKMHLYDKIRQILCRKRAAATPLAVLFTKVNQVVRGWINYFRIGSMMMFMKKFGEWLRHKIRVIIFKQWKRPRTIYENLSYLNRRFKCGIPAEKIRQTANFLLSPDVLRIEKGDRPGLVDPVFYYDLLVHSTPAQV